ncbi:DUF2269 family protein [Cohnella candidum]|nr:DUF2269 family protein [Cohnella candidum]
MNGMEILVVVHVLSALIGIGPTFLGHVFLQRRQNVQQYRSSIGFAGKMERFPKIGGTIAVLSGLGLALSGDYGTFAQLWLYGTLVIYVLIQITMIAAVAPTLKKLRDWLYDPGNQHVTAFPPEQQKWVNRASGWLYVASGLGILIFIFMIVKPGA